MESSYPSLLPFSPGLAQSRRAPPRVDRPVGRNRSGLLRRGLLRPVGPVLRSARPRPAPLFPTPAQPRAPEHTRHLLPALPSRSPAPPGSAGPPSVEGRPLHRCRRSPAPAVRTPLAVGRPSSVAPDVRSPRSLPVAGEHALRPSRSYPALHDSRLIFTDTLPAGAPPLPRLLSLSSGVCLHGIREAVPLALSHDPLIESSGHVSILILVTSAASHSAGRFLP